MTTEDEMRPLACAPDISADPMTAALIERRVADGEITVDELRDICAGKHNAPSAPRELSPPLARPTNGGTY